MALINIVSKDKLNEIRNKHKGNFEEFNNTSIGNKAHAASKLYMENIYLKELGEVALDTIDEMDMVIENKEKENNFLKGKLQKLDHYNEKEVEELLNKQVTKSHNHERAKKRLMGTLKNKSFI